MKIFENTQDTILARGSILDQVHNIIIELVINIDTLEIIKAEGQSVKVPFSECKEAINNIQNIIGIKLNAGMSNKLGESLGGRNGCIHLSEVAIETARLAANVIFGLRCGGKEWRDGKLSDVEFWEGVKPKLRGTCRVFPIDND
jgi:hypothetical protein